MLRTTWRRGFVASAMIVVLMIVAALLWTSLDGDGEAGPSGSDPTSSTQPDSSDEQSTTTSTLLSPIVVPEGELEVKPGDILPDAARCESDEFIENSLPSTEKLWSDSVSTPYVSSDPNEMFAEDLQENCGNPTLLDDKIQGFRHVKVGDFSVWDNNPWMAEFDRLANEHGLRAAFLTKHDGVDGVFVTADFQLFAELLNTILLDYKVWGVESWMTSYNAHLPGPIAGELPRVVENPNQEDLPSLILVYTIKDVCDGASVIGMNVGDKRFEIFESKCQPPAEPPCTVCPPETVPPTTVPDGRKGTPATTTPPPPVTTPGVTTTTSNSGGGDSGPGAPPPATTVAPQPTVAPPGSVPPTSSPPGPGVTVAGP